MQSQVLVLAIVAISYGAGGARALPSFTWDRASKSPEGIPLLNVHFDDGGPVDAAVLRRQNPIPLTKDETEMDVDQCIFAGYLRDEPAVPVTITGGCPFEDSFEIAINSARLKHNMFSVKKGAVAVEQIPWDSVEGKSAFRDEALHVPGLDYSYRDGASERKAFPPFGFNLKATVYYDQTFKARFSNDTLNALRRVLAHAQYFYYLGSSLNTTITLSVLNQVEIPDNITVNSLSYVRKYATNASINANIFLCYNNNKPGVVGLAWVGTTCYIPSMRTSVNHWTYSDVTTGGIVAHELGHNLGMSHDFNKDSKGGAVPRYDKQGRTCTGIGGVMDYANPIKWSTCSAEDFQRYYDSQSTFCVAAESKQITTTTTKAPMG